MEKKILIEKKILKKILKKNFKKIQKKSKKIKKLLTQFIIFLTYKWINKVKSKVLGFRVLEKIFFFTVKDFGSQMVSVQVLLKVGELFSPWYQK